CCTHCCVRRNSDMTANGWLQILFFLALILAVTKPMGIFMAHVFSRQRTFMDPVLRPMERLLYRVTGVDEDHEMRWTEYAIAMLLSAALRAVRWRRSATSGWTWFAAAFGCCCRSVLWELYFWSHKVLCRTLGPMTP